MASTPQKKKPLGPMLDWTDEELDQLSEVSDADIKAALALWHNEAPVPLRWLLDATIEEPHVKQS